MINNMQIKEKNKIPKVIHYCWFGGGQMPSLALKCIESWKRFCPDYEILLWNEKNFDVNICSYTRHAYKLKKYAFVSDYARFWILYNYGGVYFDTDVELIKGLDNILIEGSFMGCEKDERYYTRDIGSNVVIAPGLGIAANSRLDIYKKILDEYNNLEFNPDLEVTVVHIVTELFRNYGFKGNNTIEDILNVKIYPYEYFGAKDKYTGRICLTKNTISIHHYMASWLNRKQKFKIHIQHILGRNITEMIIRVKRKFREWLKKLNISD